MHRLIKAVIGTAVTGNVVYWGILTPQQQSDVEGAYRSVVNSSRAAYVLYQSVKDYQTSLSDIPYNTEEYHQARH